LKAHIALKKATMKMPGRPRRVAEAPAPPTVPAVSDPAADHDAAAGTE
jgi:hypothetical protein